VKGHVGVPGFEAVHQVQVVEFGNVDHLHQRPAVGREHAGQADAHVLYLRVLAEPVADGLYQPVAGAAAPAQRLGGHFLLFKEPPGRVYEAKFHVAAADVDSSKGLHGELGFQMQIVRLNNFNPDLSWA
jgi:hypothetical protein